MTEFRLQFWSSDQFSSIPALPGHHSKLIKQAQGGSETMLLLLYCYILKHNVFCCTWKCLSNITCSLPPFSVTLSIEQQGCHHLILPLNLTCKLFVTVCTGWQQRSTQSFFRSFHFSSFCYRNDIHLYQEQVIFSELYDRGHLIPMPCLVSIFILRYILSAFIINWKIYNNRKEKLLLFPPSHHNCR